MYGGSLKMGPMLLDPDLKLGPLLFDSGLPDVSIRYHDIVQNGRVVDRRLVGYG